MEKINYTPEEIQEIDVTSKESVEALRKATAQKDAFDFIDWFLMVASLIIAIFFLLPLYFSISRNVPLIDIIYSIIIVFAGFFMFFKKYKKYKKIKG